MDADSMWKGWAIQPNIKLSTFLAQPTLPYPFFLDICFAHFIRSTFLSSFILSYHQLSIPFHFCTAYGLTCQDGYQCNLRPLLPCFLPPFFFSPLFSSPLISFFSSYVFLGAYVALHFAICTARHCAARQGMSVQEYTTMKTDSARLSSVNFITEQSSTSSATP